MTMMESAMPRNRIEIEAELYWTASKVTAKYVNTPEYYRAAMALEKLYATTRRSRIRERTVVVLRAIDKATGGYLLKPDTRASIHAKKEA